MSRSDLEKQPGRGRPGSPPPSSLPVILPALPLGVASGLGRSHPLPSCVSPSFSLRSAPPRYVQFRNNLAFPLWLTTVWAGGGLAGVSALAGGSDAVRV